VTAADRAGPDPVAGAADGDPVLGALAADRAGAGVAAADRAGVAELGAADG
jgi:hypothetical protein